MGGILKLHGYMDVVDKATQDAKAEEQYFRVCPRNRKGQKLVAPTLCHPRCLPDKAILANSLNSILAIFLN